MTPLRILHAIHDFLPRHLSFDLPRIAAARGIPTVATLHGRRI